MVQEMNDEKKTKAQLTSELQKCRRRIAKLEKEAGKSKDEDKTAKLIQFAINHTSDAAFWMGSDARFIYINEAACRLLGYSKKELLSMSVHDIDPLFPKEAWKDHWRELKERKSLTLQSEHKAKDGRMIPVEILANYIRFDGKEYNCAFAKDVTEYQKIEQSLKDGEEKYRSLVESTNDSIYVVDRNFKYLFMNKKHMVRMGFSGNEYLGQEYSKFHTSEETDLFSAKANTVFDSGESITHEYKSKRDERYFLLTLSPIKQDDGIVKAVTVVSKDITDYKIAEEKLHNLSLSDELTGLHNRRGFFAVAEQFLKLARRQKQGIFMLYTDLDNLKEINDTFGHKEGDLALIETANLLKRNYRESDVIARIGGDEFVIIPIGTAKDNIGIITSRFEKSIETYNATSNRGYKLSLSYGLAYYDPGNPCSLDELLMQADKAMYEHKRNKHTA
jgi:diguanylate cyclase (GGDEF)-like protein/PAS domain S-box-containing protein